MSTFKGSGLGGLSLIALATLLSVGCARHRHANLTEAELRERMLDGAEHVLDYVDADEAQTARMNGILSALAPDVMPFKAEKQALAAELRGELAKQTVNPAELERIRQAAVDLFDRASQRGTRALGDAAQVLTPEQRKKLTTKWEKFSP
jgi:periplasmic protein CpxP/Spy